MRERIAQEFELLRHEYGDLIQHQDSGGEDWFLIARYAYPDGLWSVREGPVAFRAKAGYPGEAPYGFWVPASVRLQGGDRPNDFVDANEPPFPSSVGWARFSWAPEDPWTPTVDPSKGPNLLHWTRSFRVRLAQGR